MTAEIVYLCRFEGCRRQAAYPGQARCAEHRLRWVAGQSPEPPRQPAWVQRMESQGLPAKDYSGSAA